MAGISLISSSFDHGLVDGWDQRGQVWSALHNGPMHATLREYEGIKDPAEATQPLLDGLLAEMQALPGFIAYYFVDVGEAGDRMISLSVFETSEAAEESNRVAAGWVARWLADHPETAPTASRVDAGPVMASATA